MIGGESRLLNTTREGKVGTLGIPLVHPLGRQPCTSAALTGPLPTPRRMIPDI